MIISPVTVSRAPFSSVYSASGSYSYAIPRWCTHIDVVMVGGGGGGGGGDTGWTFAGQGGYAGTWSIITLERGVDIPWHLTTIGVTTGTGGTPGNAGSGNSGATGGTSSISYSDLLGSTQTVAAVGGAGGAGGNNGGNSGAVGQSPGNQVYNAQTYTGGGTATSGSSRENGKSPGGGGGGGAGGTFGSGTAGMPGAAGAVYFYAYMNILPRTQYTDILDSLANFTQTISSGGGISISSGIAGWSNTTNGGAVCLYNSQPATNNHYTGGIVNTVTANGSGLIMHCTQNLSGYYGAVFYNSYVKLIRTSSTWTQGGITELATYAMTINSGDLVEFWNIGSIFKIAVNGTVRINHNTGDPIVGAMAPYQGFGMYRVSSVNSTTITEWRGGDAEAWGKS